MKYVLPLLLVASAGWAFTRETRWDAARPWSSPESVRAVALPQSDPPWLTGAFNLAEVAEAEVDAEDPHAGLYGVGGPHAGLYDADDSSADICPRDMGGAGADVLAPEDEDPHLHARAVAPGVQLPRAGVERSAASNGRRIAELYAERSALAEQSVRVRGTVVKRTDGILGETFLHLRDGSGSAEREDDDLTVTTTEEFELGETVELEGRLRIDQDLGLGYRYAAMLTGATRSPAR